MSYYVRMKYKAGDIVKIKTWDKMGKEFGFNSAGQILCRFIFAPWTEEKVKKLHRVVTIKEVFDNYYTFNELDGPWDDDIIESLEELVIFVPIKNRFEILDL